MDSAMENEVKVVDKKHRPQTIGEEIGNAVTHGIGFLFAVVATILMLIKADTPREYVGVSLFGFGFMILYIMSCLYHSFRNGSKVKKLFRIFDHSSIYLLIGGTYAPILLCAVGGTLGLVFFIIQWVVIVAGIVLKVLRPGKNTVIHVIFCIILGWSGLLLMGQVYQFSHPLFWYILAGGLVYTIGVIVYAMRCKWAHFIWHFFVLFGTIPHFIGIYLYLLN